MSDSQEPNRLRELEEEVAREKGVSPDILRRLLAKVDQYSESHRAFGLPDDLLNILQEDLSRTPSSLCALSPLPGTKLLTPLPSAKKIPQSGTPGFSSIRSRSRISALSTASTPSTSPPWK